MVASADSSPEAGHPPPRGLSAESLLGAFFVGGQRAGDGAIAGPLKRIGAVGEPRTRNG